MKPKWLIVEKLEQRWEGLRAMLSTGSPDNDYRGAVQRCHLCIYRGDWCVKVLLPNLLKPFEIRHRNGPSSSDPLGWWSEWFEREFGVSIDRTTLHIHYGPQTWDSDTTKSKVLFFPWAGRRFHRFTLYDLGGRAVWTKLERDVRKAQRKAHAGGGWHDSFAEQHKQVEEVQKEVFSFTDFDGEKIHARCHIEEREWRAGEGLFAWLSLFRKPTIQRCLSLDFDREVGSRKGSWKGGTVGHSVTWLEGDSPEWAFRRYCAAHSLQFGRRETASAYREPVRAPGGDEAKAATA